MPTWTSRPLRAPGVVVINMDNDPDSYDYKVTRQHLAILQQATDADGNKLELHQLPPPLGGQDNKFSAARTLPPVTSTTCPSTAPSSLPSSGMQGRPPLPGSAGPPLSGAQDSADRHRPGGGRGRRHPLHHPPSTCLILRAGRLWRCDVEQGAPRPLVPAGVPWCLAQIPSHADLVELDVSGLAQGVEHGLGQILHLQPAGLAIARTGRGGTCTSPGQRVWTRMPWCCTSSRSARANPRTANLAAQ